MIAEDSAKAVAAKINAVSGETGVKAEAKTFGLLYSEYATDQTYSVRIQNKTTGTFTISNSNVADAVSKINQISGATGVTAQLLTTTRYAFIQWTGLISRLRTKARTLRFAQTLVTTANLRFLSVLASRQGRHSFQRRCRVRC